MSTDRTSDRADARAAYQSHLDLGGDQSSEWPFPSERLHHASGCNSIGAIRGFFEAGHNVGVSAGDLPADGVQELLGQAKARRDALLFVDSGAFSEVSTVNGSLAVTAPIPVAEWRRRLDVYEALARAWGPRLSCVAPDLVGDQQKTLERLTFYRPEVRRVRDHGCRVIVAIQRGRIPMHRFWWATKSILGGGAGRLVPGIPMRKAGASSEELEEFAARLVADLAAVSYALLVPGLRNQWPDSSAVMLHLLGCGPRSRRYTSALDAIRQSCLWATVFSDSVRLTALVGRGAARAHGLPARPRPLTAAQDAVRAEAPDLCRRDALAESISRTLQEDDERLYRKALARGWKPGST